jgi:hypothetical protein
VQRLAHVDGPGSNDHLAGLDVGVVQHLLDQAEQMPAAADDAAQVAGELW